MSFLDGIGSILGDVMQGKPVDLSSIASQVFAHAGGLNGIVAQLQNAGLGEQVSSWIGSGGNLPVSAEQIRSALSSEQLRSLASNFGVDLDQVSELLAHHLPGAVDAATPAGELPPSA